MRRASFASLLVLALAAGACAPKRLALPTDLVTPLPNFQQVHQQVTQACRGVRTLTAELALSGRAGDERLRGRVIAGFAQPASMRLEGVAPFGQPVFILVTTGGRNSTLLLPRDARVVQRETAEDILGALTGVTLGPAELQAVLTGCVTAAMPTGGYMHRNGWASIVFQGGATMYLQPRGQAWELRAARLGAWQIEYVAGTGTLPASVTLHAAMPVRVDLRAEISQVEANVDLDANAFTVTVPRDAQPLSLDVLRANGPLKETR